VNKLSYYIKYYSTYLNLLCFIINKKSF